MAVQRAYLDRAPYATELDESLAGVYRELNIPDVFRKYQPPDDNINFMDLILARAILRGMLSREDAQPLIDFYETRLEIAANTLVNREAFVLAERGAFFATGAESTRLHLAAESEVLALHRRSYEVASRCMDVLKAFVEHDCDLGKLDPVFVSLLLPGVDELIARHLGR